MQWRYSRSAFRRRTVAAQADPLPPTSQLDRAAGTP
jgi:hypothetical protein